MMRKLVLVVSLLMLTSCSSDKVSLPERLTLANDTIASTATAATAALNMGHISVQRACQVEAYGRFAGSVIDQAWLQWVMGKPERAEDHLSSARLALSGSLPAAQKLATQDCN